MWDTALPFRPELKHGVSKSTGEKQEVLKGHLWYLLALASKQNDQLSKIIKLSLVSACTEK